MPALFPIMVGAVVGGTVLQTIGQIKSGNAAQELGDYNANVAEQQAVDAVKRGAEDEQKFRLGVKGLIGKQRAGFAGQNVDVGTGSAVDVQADAAYLGELDARTIRVNAAREAYGFKVQAENYRRGGDAAKTASMFGAASTILGGAATTTSMLGKKYGFLG